MLSSHSLSCGGSFPTAKKHMANGIIIHCFPSLHPSLSQTERHTRTHTHKICACLSTQHALPACTLSMAPLYSKGKNENLPLALTNPQNPAVADLSASPTKLLTELEARQEERLRTGKISALFLRTTMVSKTMGEETYLKKKKIEHHKVNTSLYFSFTYCIMKILPYHPLDKTEISTHTHTHTHKLKS